jgi:hypothetical protein
MPESLRLAAYHPSAVISDTHHWTILKSFDSVDDIAEFYAAELNRRGWQTTSAMITETGATIVAQRGPHGATISIANTGSGSAITITSY